MPYKRQPFLSRQTKQASVLLGSASNAVVLKAIVDTVNLIKWTKQGHLGMSVWQILQDTRTGSLRWPSVLLCVH